MADYLPGFAIAETMMINDEAKLSLGDVYASIWADLRAGVADRRHGFHTVSVATVERIGDGYAPRVRTVVLREATEATRTLIFHTDARAPKIEMLKTNARIAFNFYADDKRIQVVAEGAARIHHQDDIARERFNQSKLWSRRCYLSEQKPGTKIEMPSSCLPAHLLEQQPDVEESERGFANFAAIIVTLDKLEWLWLTAKGNVRAGFEWRAHEFDGSWLAP